MYVNTKTPNTHINRYNGIEDDFLAIRRQARELKQIESHHQSRKDPILSEMKTPDLPLLGYYLPDARKDYAPRSSLQSSRRRANKSRLTKETR